MNYRTELTEQIEKQRLSDTFLTFLPKNTSGYTYVNQRIEVQIPKSEHVVNLAKAYIHVSLQIPFKISAHYSSSRYKYYVGMLNSASIFDEISIHSNNKCILSDTHAQINSRLWQLSKATHYLHANYASFINIDDITRNEGFIVHDLNNIKVSGAFEPLTFNMKIPLPCIFNCFDNCEAFSTTQLNDNVTLSLQLSSPEKYLCLFRTDVDSKIEGVLSFNADNTCLFNDGKVLEFSSREVHDYKINEGFKVVTTGHYPTEEEKINYNNVIANGGWFREFSNYDIQGQDANFGPNVYGNSTQTALNYNTNVSNIYDVVILATHNQSQTIYDKPKISDIEMNASELWKLANENTHVDSTYDGDNDLYLDLLNSFGNSTFKNLERFDKSITNDYRYKGDKFAKLYRVVEAYIELKYSTTSGAKQYTKINRYGIKSNHVVRTLTNTKQETSVTFNDTTETCTFDFKFKFEIDGKKKYNILTESIALLDTFTTIASSDVTRTRAYSDTNEKFSPTFARNTGDNGFILNFKVSSENEEPLNITVYREKTLGSYLQYFKFAPSNQIGYSGDYFSHQLNYKYKSCYEEKTFDDGEKYVLTRNNYVNSTLYCCCRTLSFLVFKEGGIDIINPYSEEIDVRCKFSASYNSYCGNGHGVGGLVPGLFNPIGSLIGKGISGIRKLVKENRNHANNTYAYSTLGKDGYEKHKEIIQSHSTMKKKKFKNFINGLKQMESQLNSHGISVNNISNEKEEMAEPATFDELNLTPFVQSYSADLADIEYKNQLILDYKYGFNREKIRLLSFGSECAMDGNNYHGRVGDWFRRVGRKIKGWFKRDGKRILKNVGSDLLGIAKEYAARVATGEMSMSDIRSLKPELRDKVLSIIKSNTDGTKLEGITGDAMNWYKKYKSGELSWSDIPKDMVGRIKELDLNEKSGRDHGLIVRHGFIAGPRIRPSELYSVQKQRVAKLIGKSPMELRRNDLRKLYRFQYLKKNGVVDTSHGRLYELLRQRMPPMNHPSIPGIKPIDLTWKGKNPRGKSKDYLSKWRKDKESLLSTEHGIQYLDELRKKKSKYEGDQRYQYLHKKYKKYRKWTDRMRMNEKNSENTN